MLKICTVLGARPQFIKAAPVSTALKIKGHKEILVHTGQHFDRNMSDIFFNEMAIPKPDYNLGINSGSHAWQTGKMLIELERIMLEETPELVLVYGDTNSTLAGALAACKLNIPIAHVEAGLRSYNREMPEEHNRVLTDHCSEMLFCPTQTAVDNLFNEGLKRNVFLVGDTMYDAVLQFASAAEKSSKIMELLKLNSKEFILTTIHRPYNTDNYLNLSNIISALCMLKETVIFPVHPRTRQKIEEYEISKVIKKANNLIIIEPVGYIDMIMLEQNARIILTDSGGVQKEAYWLGVPCVTLRPETEWVETVEAGWNYVAGTNQESIIEAVEKRKWPNGTPPLLFGDGKAANYILDHLEQLSNQ